MNISLLKKWAAGLAVLIFSAIFLVQGSWFSRDEIQFADLPVEAQHTWRLIRSGGPFPYGKDGTVFHNRERRLPEQARGYYREYTVPTPGLQHRGARRIVAGSPPATSGEYYYTDDHYRRFRRIRGH